MAEAVKGEVQGADTRQGGLKIAEIGFILRPPVIIAAVKNIETVDEMAGADEIIQRKGGNKLP